MSISAAIEPHRFGSAALLAAERAALGYLLDCGYLSESFDQGMVTWRLVLPTAVPPPPPEILLPSARAGVPAGAICTANDAEISLHPHAALSITALTPQAAAACRRWLADEFLAHTLPRLLQRAAGRS